MSGERNEVSTRQIWVDADACPKAIKEILFRAAERLGMVLVLVANRRLRLPRSTHIKALVVPAYLDAADHAIVEGVRPGDLVVTADILLADAVLAKGGHVLDPRGEQYTRENIGERLAVRNFLDGLRGAGVVTSGPPPLSPTDRKIFADHLDRFLARHVKTSARPRSK